MKLTTDEMREILDISYSLSQQPLSRYLSMKNSINKDDILEDLSNTFEPEVVVKAFSSFIESHQNRIDEIRRLQLSRQ